MSVWKEGRYATNITWVAQLLYNGGVKELEEWLIDQPQTVKDDISVMLTQLSQHIKSETNHTVHEAYYESLSIEKNDSIIQEKPKLRLVKDYKADDLYTTD